MTVTTCVDRIKALTKERDTACAAVLELEKKLAEATTLDLSARYARAFGVDRLKDEIADLRATLENIGRELDATGQLEQDHYVDAVRELADQRNIAHTTLALRTTERDDWERACKNREDDLRGARAEAERYAAEAEAMKAERDTARREQFIAADHRETVLGITSRKLVAMTARAEKAELELDNWKKRHQGVFADNCELTAELAAATKAVDEARCAVQLWINHDPEEAQENAMSDLYSAICAVDARKNSGSGESPASALGCNRANAPEAGDFTALVKALREVVTELYQSGGSWESPRALRLLAEKLEKGGGDAK